jgi:hypothetical protein
MATTASARATTAHLDPWIVFVESDAGGCSPSPFLFGWAAHHHRLHGLTWMRSSTVVSLEEAGRRAATASGTRYVLGRRAMRPEDLSAEGRIAWKALVLGEASAFERHWLGALKAARWLGVPPPTLDPDALAAFLARHTAHYLALRSTLATGPQGSA